MFSRLEALPESESRHELGAKEGFVKEKSGGSPMGRSANLIFPAVTRRLREGGLRSLDFVVGEVKT